MKQVQNYLELPGEEELTKPVIKEGAYPYNLITCKQAQEKSKELATGGKTSSLVFGIQWDLTLKHIEEKGGKTLTELKNDSTSWGNYKNATFEITKGKYSIENGKFVNVEGEYTKQVSTSAMLSTGATERNSVLNIYELAGNVWEWTLEKTPDKNNPCGRRGGNFNLNGSDYSAAGHGKDSTSYRGSYGFRISLW